MWNHYNRSHELDSRFQASLRSDGHIVELEPMSARQEELITSQIVVFLVHTCLPLSVATSNKVFALIELLQPHYAIPSRQMLYRKMIIEHRFYQQRTKWIINSDLPMRVSLTIDACSSRIFRRYFCVSVHWIYSKWDIQSAVVVFLNFESLCDGPGVQTILTEFLDDLGILNKFIAITSYNGS